METFKVVVEGRCLPGFDPAQVRAALAKLVRQTEDVAGRLLAGHEVVVKSGVDLVASTRYTDALWAIGVAAKVAPEALEFDDDLIGHLADNPPETVAASLVTRAPSAGSTTRRMKPVEGVRPSEMAIQKPSKSASSTRTGLRILGALIVVGLTLYIGDKMSGRTNATPARSTPEKVVTTPQSRPPAGQPETFNPFATGVFVDRDKHAITLSGEITSAMLAHVKAVLTDPGFISPNQPLLYVYLNSKGGDIYAAMDIGRAIKKVWGSVVQTITIVLPDAECYSACVLILPAGQARVRGGRIGIHRPYAALPTGNADDAKRWFDKMSVDAKTYLREMNIRESLYDDMVSIPPERIHIFESREEMDRYGLIDFDPVTEESAVGGVMRKFGITDRQVYMERNERVKRDCVLNKESFQESYNCAARIYAGG